MPKPQFNIVIIGSGNMANAMALLLSAKHNIIQVVSRNTTTGRALAKKHHAIFSSDLNQVATTADFYFLCVPDDTIKTVCKKLKHVKGLVIHHSGATPLTEIPFKYNRAVVYPFLSIQPGINLNKKETPFFVNTETESNAFLLQQLFKGYKFSLTPLKDKERIQLHLAAVLVHNFTNHLYYQAIQLSQSIKGSRKLLHNLAMQALDNLDKGTAYNKQTGPARRNDLSTQKKHQQLLRTNSDLNKIYRYLSQSITKTYNHE